MYGEKKYSLWFRSINGGKIRKFTWANIVNKAALRRMDTLICHIDRPAKHDGLLCRFCFCFFWFSFFNVYIGFHYII